MARKKKLSLGYYKFSKLVTHYAILKFLDYYNLIGFTHIPTDLGLYTNYSSLKGSLFPPENE